LLHSRADALVGTRSRAIRRGTSIKANKCHICLYTRERAWEKPKASFATATSESATNMLRDVPRRIARERVPTTPATPDFLT